MLIKVSSLFNKSSSFENYMTNKSVSATARQYQIKAGWGKCNIEEDNFKFYGLSIRPIYRQN